MVYLKGDAILTRIRELVEDGLGSYRAISASRFTGGLHDTQPAATQARLGILAQKPAEASITAVRRHPQRLVTGGSVQVHLIEVEIKIVRTVEIAGTVDDDLRDDVKGLAAEDADALSQVLEWPGNLATTSGGTSTDLKSLLHQDSRARLVGTAGEALRLETVHRFTGTALSRPATS
jgi:hypothetical protein